MPNFSLSLDNCHSLGAPTVRWTHRTVAREAPAVIPVTTARTDLHFGFCLFLSPRLGRRFRLRLGFPLDAGGGLCSSFLLGIRGGQTINRVGGLAGEVAHAGCPTSRLSVGGEAGLRLLLMLGWPGIACGDGG